MPDMPVRGDRIATAGADQLLSTYLVAVGLLAVLLGACAPTKDSSDKSAPRTERNAASPASDRKSDTWHEVTVVIPFTACANAEDFHGSVDLRLLAAGREEFPETCHELAVGTRIRLLPEGKRPTASYRGFTVEQGRLISGAPIWSDEFNDLKVASDA